MNSLQWWRDLSISKKLYGLVGVMACLIAVELITLIFAVDVLSAVRSFVGGEGLWSKSQKNALLELQSYAFSKDEQHYLLFLKNLEVQAGDRQARLEMMKPTFNYEIVRQGFQEGKNNPSDIPPMVRLIRRFHWISYLSSAIDAWVKADQMVLRLGEVGEKIHYRITHQAQYTREQQQADFATIAQMNLEITQFENQFSYELGEGSRWLEHTLMYILFVAVLLGESTGLFLTFSFSRSLTRTLRELTNAAKEIGQGNFNEQLVVDSKDELGQLSGAINQMAQNLEEISISRSHAEDASHIKSLFLANMSHEIRTPLGAMLGFVELLRDRNLSKEEEKEYLDIISRTGENLVTIINDILDLSKVEAGKIEIKNQQFLLPTILNDIRLLLQLRCDSKAISLKFNQIGEVPAQIISDPIRLRQILINLVGNAIKFTSRGGITVSYFVKDHFLNFSIEDSGIGIAQSEVSKLFKPFSQGDLSIRKAHGGTGLGLTLSKSLATLMGGDAWLAKSDVQQGSVFMFKIALREPERKMQLAPSSHNESSDYTELLANKCILLVEDALENQILFKQYLKKSAVIVEVANNGLEGYEMAKKGKYDLIIMDMQMPIMDGYTAVESLRKKGYTRPILALTAHAMTEDLEKCVAVGCNEAITKPVQRKTLLDLTVKYTRDVGSKGSIRETS